MKRDRVDQGAGQFSVIQINVAHRINAHEEVMRWVDKQVKRMEEGRIDGCVAMIQEPYLAKRGITQLNKSCEAFWSVVGLNGKERPRVLIVAAKEMGGIMLTQYTDRWTVAVKLVKAEVVIVAHYGEKEVKIRDGWGSVGRCIRQQKIAVIGSDTNAYHSLWGGESKQKHGEGARKRGREIKDVIDEVELVVCNQIPHQATFENERGQQSYIDATFATRKLSRKIVRWRVSKKEWWSDHRAIRFEVEGVVQRRQREIKVEESMEGEKEMQRKLPKQMSKGMKKILEHQLLRLKIDKCSKSGTKDTLEQWVRMYEIQLGSVIDGMLEHTKDGGKRRDNGKYRKVWWTQELDSMHKQMKQLKRRWERYRYWSDEIKYRKMKQEFQTKVKGSKIKAWRDFVEKETNPWKIATGIMRQKEVGKSINRTLKKADGSYTVNAEETIETIRRQFFPEEVGDEVEHIKLRMRVEEIYSRWRREGNSGSGRGNSIQSSDLSERDRESEQRHEATNRDVRIGMFEGTQSVIKGLKEKRAGGRNVALWEIERALKELPNQTAPGIDGISNEMIKGLCKSFRSREQVRRCISESIRLGYVPNSWKIAKIVLIPKPQTQEDQVKSMRPISLTSTLGKLAERVVMKRIVRQIERSGKMSTMQHAYRKGGSTQTAIYDVLRFAQDVLDRKMVCVCAFMDISGAFDKTWHVGILWQLYQLGVSKEECLWVQSFLSDRKALITYGGCTKEVEVRQGCPQGGVISPILWNVFFNELLVNKGRRDSVYGEEKVRIVGYADDAVLICGAKTCKAASHILTRKLKEIEAWARKYKVEFNQKKLAAMTITRKKQIVRPEVYYAGQLLEAVTQYKYLGVVLDERLRWGPQINKVLESGWSVVNMCRGIVGTRWGMHMLNVRLLVKCLLCPILLYGVAFWGWAALKKKILKRFDRIVRQMGCMAIRGLKSVSGEVVTRLAGVVPFREMILRSARQVVLIQMQRIHFLKAKLYEKRCSQESPNNMDQFHWMLTQGLEDVISKVQFDSLMKDYDEEQNMIEGIEKQIVRLRSGWFCVDISDRVQAIYTQLHREGWIIYTDASNSIEGRGWGFVVYYQGEERYRDRGATIYSDISEAELVAIRKGVEYIEAELKGESVEIHSDSTKVLEAIRDGVEVVEGIRAVVQQLKALQAQGTVVQMRWVPAHMGVIGNEIADQQARLGVMEEVDEGERIGKKGFKRYIAKYQENREDNQWRKVKKGLSGALIDGRKDFDNFMKSMPSIDTVRVVTGHCMLKSFLYRKLGRGENADCERCGIEEETVEHYMFECSGYDNIRKELWGTSVRSEIIALIKKKWSTLTDYVKRTERFKV